MQFLVKKMFVGYIKKWVSAICIAEPLDMFFSMHLVCFCFLNIILLVIFVSASYSQNLYKASQIENKKLAL